MPQARMMIENPDSVEITMKITMTAKQWCDLRDALQNAPGGTGWLRGAVGDLLAKVRKVVYEEEKAGS